MRADKVNWIWATITIAAFQQPIQEEKWPNNKTKLKTKTKIYINWKRQKNEIRKQGKKWINNGELFEPQTKFWKIFLFEQQENNSTNILLLFRRKNFFGRKFSIHFIFVPEFVSVSSFFLVRIVLYSGVQLGNESEEWKNEKKNILNEKERQNKTLLLW